MLLPNHNSWWDGFFIYWINRYLFKRPVYLMMLEEQLKKYSFFSRVGAYSINPDSHTGVHQSLKYTTSILQNISNPPPLVCIFPQGELKPPMARPLGVKNGYEWIAKHSLRDMIMIPLAMKPVFLDQQCPDVFIAFGQSFINKPGQIVEPDRLDKIITELLDRIDQNIKRGDKGTCFWEGRRSTNEKWNNFKKTIFGQGTKS